MADKKSSRPRKARKNNNKVRVKLAGIESYEKELEFTAEGPGRVVVRLERLMGSDRIRITDPKYLSTLIERLEGEESQGWRSRSHLRKKAEKNRSRQLAIEGLMEPTSDMQDLWNHPVFRVNRVLNRLAVFDQNMSHAAGTIFKVPPIVPTEPFTELDDGSVFKSYPGHTVFTHEEEEELQPEPGQKLSQRASVVEIVEIKKNSKASSGGRRSLQKDGSEKNKPSANEEDDEDEMGDEEEGEDGEVDEAGIADIPLLEEFEEPVGTASIVKMKQQYGIPLDENLERDWEAFRSHLVTRVYEDAGGSMEELYTMADDVIGVYSRQSAVTDDFMGHRNKKVDEEEKAMLLLLPRQPSSMAVSAPPPAEAATTDTTTPAAPERNSAPEPPAPAEEGDDEEDAEE